MTTMILALLAVFIQLAGILVMSVFILFALMALGIVPSRRIVNFLQKHEQIQSILGIGMMVGILISFVVVLINLV